MADPIDQNDENNALLLDADIAHVRKAAAAIDTIPSKQGECDVCGEESMRLVECEHPRYGDVYACCPCRDKYKLPLTTVRRV